MPKMAAFVDLEDSPMFHNQIHSLEQTSDELRDRCRGLYKASKSFLANLSEQCKGYTTFADALELFGGGKDDPLSLSLGGPIISQFINAFRELASYKELLCSLVDHVLVDRLTQFMSVDLQDAKDSRRRFDKSIHAYDQAREKFTSLKKGTREDILASFEEDLHNSKSAYERNRLYLVTALANIEAKMKYEFLESLSAVMDAHLRHFKLGYELLKEMEPHFHQVFTFSQQYKEIANAEQDDLARRIQNFRTKAENMENLQTPSNAVPSQNVIGIHSIGVADYKDIHAVMQSSANGEVCTIKQGYLNKQSSSLKGDWKRRFFVLDSRGTLYYYRTKGPKPAIAKSYQPTASVENGNGLFGRFRAKNNQTSTWKEESLGCRTVDLQTSTIKMEAEEKDLRLCFRIISPAKSYTLQAETEADRMDWINKITGVITSLLNSSLMEQGIESRANDKDGSNFVGDASSDVRSGRMTYTGNDVENRSDGVSKILWEIPGNDQCAECGSPQPDWASLNLGILVCIHCSGAHRNLGVHISKVRSITLDVKVWDPTMLDLFRALGNDYCNSIWEEGLLAENERADELDTEPVVKPSAHDSFHKKEKYIHQKYMEKRLISKKVREPGCISSSKALWDAVKVSDLRGIYRIIAASDAAILNTTFEEVQDRSSDGSSEHSPESDCRTHDPAMCPYLRGSSNEPDKCLRGCSILHLACHIGDCIVVELLLQFGSDVNMRDFHGRTPLHHCIAKGNNELAKYLLRRGADGLVKDCGGLTVLERAMEFGAITDEELFVLLVGNR